MQKKNDVEARPEETAGKAWIVKTGGENCSQSPFLISTTMWYEFFIGF
jgi:hypothetical protein